MGLRELVEEKLGADSATGGLAPKERQVVLQDQPRSSQHHVDAQGVDQGPRMYVAAVDECHVEGLASADDVGCRLPRSTLDRHFPVRVGKRKDESGFFRLVAVEVVEEVDGVHRLDADVHGDSTIR